MAQPHGTLVGSSAQVARGTPGRVPTPLPPQQSQWAPRCSQCCVVTGVGRSGVGVAGCPQMHSPSAVSPLPAPQPAPAGRALSRSLSSGRGSGKWHPGCRRALARMCGTAGSKRPPLPPLRRALSVGSGGERGWLVASWGGHPAAGLRLRAPHPMAGFAPRPSLASQSMLGTPESVWWPWSRTVMRAPSGGPGPRAQPSMVPPWEQSCPPAPHLLMHGPPMHSPSSRHGRATPPQ